MQSVKLTTLIGVLLIAACQGKKEKLVSKVKASIDMYEVAFLIMDGVYNTELTAPFDIFQHTQYRKGIKPMRTFTIAKNLDPITTFEGIRILPDYSYPRGEYPDIDILVVPSAEHHLDTDLENQSMISFVKKAASSAQYVTSHCDGAFVLAEAGLLDSVYSTTFPSDIDTYKKKYPNLQVVEDVWIVHDGKFITSAGGARSFEAAMYLTDILYGPDITRSLGKGLILPWPPDSLPIFIADSVSID